MRVMVIETKGDELLDARYENNAMESSHRLRHWGDIEISDDDYERYERLRIELYELIEELKEKN
jgi:hypothetical protein